MKNRVVVLLFICMCIILTGCKRNDSVSMISYDDVSELNIEAKQSYESKKYDDAIIKYSEALKLNPINIDAQLGMVRCQIAMENYSMAKTNLSAALAVDPTISEIYDLYVELGNVTKEISYAKTAVSLAKTNHVDGFLTKLPKPPIIDVMDGVYDSALEVNIIAEDSAEIYVKENRNQASDVFYKYHNPIQITTGETNIEVYCVKDGIPSETVSVKYECEYPPVEVIFTDPAVESFVRTSLNIPNEPITNLDCEGITELTLKGGKDLEIVSLVDLVLFPNLRKLDLENTKLLTDYSMIEKCQRLYSLRVNNSELEDISFTKSLGQLNYFYAYDNDIKDLTPLSGCDNLKYFHIQRNPIADLSPLNELHLKEFSFSASYVQDLMVIKNWTSLERINISECGGVDLSCLDFLSEIPNLQILDLYVANSSYISENKIPFEDISFIQNLTQLKGLYLDGLADYSQLNVVKPLKNLTNLYFCTVNDKDEPSRELILELEKNLPNCKIKF